MMEVLAYAVYLFPYLVAALLGLAVPLILVGAYNQLGFGLVVIAVAWMGDALVLTQPLLRIGFTIYAPDVPMVLIALVAIARWFGGAAMPRRHPGWLLLAAVFSVGLVIGLARFGTAAGVQARPDFYGLAAASYAMSFRLGAEQLRRYARGLTVLAILLLLLAVYRWIVYYAPIRELLPPGGVYNVDGPTRVIHSNFALALMQVFVLGIFFGAGEMGLRAARIASPLLLAGSIVLQHRSVWLAGLAGVLLSLMLSRAQRAPLWQQVMLALAIGTVTIVPLAFNKTITAQVESSAERALAGSGTVAERFQNWRATLQKWAADGPRAIAIGRVRGDDTLRTVEDETGRERLIDYNAHNHYVNTLSGMGVLGLAAYLWVLLGTLGGLVKGVFKGGDDAGPTGVLLVLMAIQLVYFVAYGVDFMQYVVLGLATAWVAQHRGARAPAPLPASAQAGVVARP